MARLRCHVVMVGSGRHWGYWCAGNGWLGQGCGYAAALGQRSALSTYPQPPQRHQAVLIVMEIGAAGSRSSERGIVAGQVMAASAGVSVPLFRAEKDLDLAAVARPDLVP